MVLHLHQPHSVEPPKAIIHVLMPLEELHRALVFFGGFARFEGSQIAPLAAFRIFLA
jgi:hypothetical protein